MAETRPTPPEDPVEAAFRRALLDDESGREARRARLMAALPTPGEAAPAVVATDALARRRSPVLAALLVTGLLLGTLLVLKGRGSPVPAGPDPSLAAASAPAPAPELASALASAPLQVAQAEAAKPTAWPHDVAPARTPDPAATRETERRTRPVSPSLSRPVIVADATPPSASVHAQTRAAPAEPAAAPVAAAPAPAVAAAPAPLMAAAPPAVAAAPAAERGSTVDARAKGQDLARGESTLEDVARPAPPAPARAAMLAPPSPLLAAAARGDAAGVRAALQAGGSVQARDAQGRTPLMLAARAGSREGVALLMAAGARPGDRDAQGWTAADHARDKGHERLLDLLREP
ncbi:MAG: ankyrin repeat domain-containing protein [Burkholderiales bacterium]|nr:MAG: ankyrin repeat domain-containing protein [Burkholderiales bacterium]